MPSLSERIASRQSIDDSTEDIPTNPVSIPTKGHIGIAAEWCRASNAIGSGCILRIDHATNHRSAAGWEWPVRPYRAPYRAPWRDNLRARDETNR